MKKILLVIVALALVGCEGKPIRAKVVKVTHHPQTRGLNGRSEHYRAVLKTADGETVGTIVDASFSVGDELCVAWYDDHMGTEFWEVTACERDEHGQ
jgi:hypothetical protein